MIKSLNKLPAILKMGQVIYIFSPIQEISDLTVVCRAFQVKLQPISDIQKTFEKIDDPQRKR